MYEVAAAELNTIAEAAESVVPERVNTWQVPSTTNSQNGDKTSPLETCAAISIILVTHSRIDFAEDCN